MPTGVNEKMKANTELDSIIETLRQKICPGSISAHEIEPVVFLVGAGVSREMPSGVPVFPQKTCIEKLKFISSLHKDKIDDQLRPEFFFQILYNQLGKPGLIPLDVLNTRKLNALGATVLPNGNHYFLAKMIEQGHIVITTNFDSLIEDAYSKQTGNVLANVAIYDEDFEKLNKNRSFCEGVLIKLHGSFFSPDGKDTKDSIMTLLHQLQRNIPSYKTDLVRTLLRDHDWIVMGHSARDDYDLYPVLSDDLIEKKQIFWIKHETDIGKYSVVREKNTFFSKLQKYNKISSAIPEWKDAGKKNICSILYSYPDNNGILIKANTLSFVEKICNPVKMETISHMNLSENDKIGNNIVEMWFQSLTVIEEKKISAELLKSLNEDGATRIALDLYREATLAEICQITGRLNLEEADAVYRIIRKKMDPLLLLNGKTKARSALTIFQGLNDIEGMADAYYVLTHLNRIENQIDEGMHCGIEAINSYTVLIQSDPTKDYKLAQALRALALIVMNTTPDVTPLKDGQIKENVKKILNCCSELCTLSEQIYGDIGNVTGERGLNQTLNIHGLIALRMGDYKAAETIFGQYVNLSDSSRFIRESFQAYRNLGISEISLAMIHSDLDDSLCKKSIDNLRKCLICLDVNPLKIENPPENRDIFNSLYNYARALVICSDPETKNIIPVLEKYNNTEIMQKVSGSDYWHWQCILLALLCRAETDDAVAENYAKQMLEIYKKIGVENIKKHKFGPQNYNENILTVCNRLPLMGEKELPNGLPKEIERIISLPYDVKNLIKQLDEISSAVRNVLDQRNTGGAKTGL